MAQIFRMSVIRQHSLLAFLRIKGNINALKKKKKKKSDLFKVCLYNSSTVDLSLYCIVHNFFSDRSFFLVHCMKLGNLKFSM